jgi:hypothetical protein
MQADLWRWMMQILRTKDEAGGRSDIQGRVGLRYRHVEDFILDAAVGRSLTPDPEV